MRWMSFLLVCANFTLESYTQANVVYQMPFTTKPLPQPFSTLPNKPQEDAQSLLNVPQEYVTRSGKRQKKSYSGQAVGNVITGAFKDIFNLHKNLFTWDTFKIVASTFPLFIGARMIDERLHGCFYDSSCHKNKNQMPGWCHDVAKVSIGVPIVLLGLDAFFSKIPERQWTSQILLVGMPFVIWTKKLIKQAQFDGCQRPWNEYFDCESRSYGGFPSGHTAQATYMAVLFGMRYGPRMAVPLGALTAFIGVTFVSCNRHYLSQVIGGAAFGAIYGLAASKVVDMKLTNQVKLRINMDERGRPSFSAGVSW